MMRLNTVSAELSAQELKVKAILWLRVSLVARVIDSCCPARKELYLIVMYIFVNPVYSKLLYCYL
jgi:hypothetical protein